jgi:hypothetical protein
MDDKLSHTLFWETILKNIDSHIEEFENFVKYILNEFGTSEPCNRFDIGNSLEFSLKDILEKMGFTVQELPNAKRIDLCINKTYKISIKYSSTGDIKLHNSNNCSNTDMNMTDLLLITPDNLYLLTNENIKEYDVELVEYLKNTGDGLALKRSILNALNKKKFKYKYPINLAVNKSECKRRLCSKLFYEKVKEEFKTKAHH